MTTKVAFITGASRGIGKACAIELGDAGFDIAITARTVTEGERREHSSTLAASDTSPLPGSLETTRSAVEATGARCLTVQADILEPHTLGSAVATVLERWGRIDLVLHNARYIGPGHMDLIEDTPIDLLRQQMEGNVFAPLIVNSLVLPGMIERGSGMFVNITSASGYGIPTKPAGQGGWGLGYGMSKAAFHRIAGHLDAELRDRGILAWNVQPDLIATERIGQDMAEFGIENTGAPMEVIGKVARWLATEPEAADLAGETIEAQHFCHDKGLLPGWDGPRWMDNNILYDPAAENLRRLNEALRDRS